MKKICIIASLKQFKQNKQPQTGKFTNVKRNLPRTAAPIIYDTKLTLPEANIEQFLKILSSYQMNVNGADDAVVPDSMS